MDLGQGNVDGDLAADSNGGAITQSGGLTVAGSSAVDAGTGAITLANAGNDFGGAISLTGGDATIVDQNALTFGALATGNLIADSTGALNLGAGDVGGSLSANSSGGAITQTGALSVTGTSVISAGNGDIHLTNADNDFGGAVNLAGSNVLVTDRNDLAISTLVNGSGGDVALIAGGILTLSSGITTTGDLTLASNGGSLASAGSLSGNDVSLTGRDGVILMHDITASGALALHSKGPITQSGGSLLVSGDSTIDAGTGAITLANAGNDFGGAISLTGGDATIVDQNALTFGALATGNLIADGSGALNLGSGSISGNLGARSHGGAITQSGALTVAGSSVIDAGAGSISLANAGNDFGGAVSLTGGNATIIDQNALDVGSTVIAGTLDVRSGGDLAQSGALSANGLTGASTGTTTLADTNNAVANLGDFSAAGFSLVNTTPLSIVGTLDSSGDIHLDSGDVTVTGALDAAGTIRLGATTTLLFTGNGALAGDLVDDTSVAFDQNIDNLYAGSLSGSGVLDKLGGGTLVLDGDSSAFVGTTDVQAGTLIVSGNAGDGAILGGDVSVAANATLGGYGEIGGNASLSSGARLAPGNGIGTVSISASSAASARHWSSQAGTCSGVTHSTRRRRTCRGVAYSGVGPGATAVASAAATGRYCIAAGPIMPPPVWRRPNPASDRRCRAGGRGGCGRRRCGRNRARTASSRADRG